MKDYLLINQAIQALPDSMLESENIEHTFNEAFEILNTYNALSEEDKRLVNDIDKVNDLLDGNSSALNIDCIESQSNSLKGKTIGYLGSSITVGYASENISFVDYIARLTGSISIKQAISGGPLAKKMGMRDKISYITQLLDGTLTKQDNLDAFIVQLSTNDAALGIEMGELSNSTDYKNFDYSTVIGAMEYIIGYAKEKWNCPVMFYINAYLSDDAVESFCKSNNGNILDIKKKYQNNYKIMIDSLYKVQDKWNIGIIDMWNDTSFRNMSTLLREYYMKDVIHPRKAGYLFWYTPFMIDKITSYIFP